MYKDESGTDNSWSCWTDWSSCSTSCGSSGGTRVRTRACVPGTGGSASSLTCSGDSKESESCGSTDACPEPHCPVGFQYSVGYVLYLKLNTIFRYKSDPV